MSAHHPFIKSVTWTPKTAAPAATILRTKQPDSLAAAHGHFIAALASNKPNHIPTWACADGFDLEARAEHVKSVLSALDVYLRAVIIDTKSAAKVSIDERYLFAELADLGSDLVGTLENAAEKTRTDAEWDR